MTPPAPEDCSYFLKPKASKKQKPTRPKPPARTANPRATGSFACKEANAANCKSEIAKTLSPFCRAKLTRDCFLKGIKVDIHIAKDDSKPKPATKKQKLTKKQKPTDPK